MEFFHVKTVHNYRLTEQVIEAENLKAAVQAAWRMAKNLEETAKLFVRTVEVRRFFAPRVGPDGALVWERQAQLAMTGAAPYSFFNGQVRYGKQYHPKEIAT